MTQNIQSLSWRHNRVPTLCVRACVCVCSHKAYLQVPHDYHNTQRLFHYTAFTSWSLQWKPTVLCEVRTESPYTIQTNTGLLQRVVTSAFLWGGNFTPNYPTGQHLLRATNKSEVTWRLKCMKQSHPRDEIPPLMENKFTYHIGRSRQWAPTWTRWTQYIFSLSVSVRKKTYKYASTSPLWIHGR
jgi:hypothetical protein